MRLRDFRKRKRAEDPAQRGKLAERLAHIAGGWAKGTLPKPAHGFVVIFLGAEGPVIDWAGMDHEDLADASAVLFDARLAGRRRKDMREEVQRRWENRMENRARHERDKERYVEEHPWVCDIERCSRRFATERGVRAHQRSCPWRKAS